MKECDVAPLPKAVLLVVLLGCVVLLSGCSESEEPFSQSIYFNGDLPDFIPVISGAFPVTGSDSTKGCRA